MLFMCLCIVVSLLVCVYCQIRGIVESATSQKERFRRKWDHIKRYLKENKIPKEVLCYMAKKNVFHVAISVVIL